MNLLQIKRFSRLTASRWILAGFMGAIFSSPLIVGASEPASTAPGMTKEMPMNHMSMDHKHMAMTGDVDYDFVMMMRMHHEKGVKMAEKEVEKGKDPDMLAAAKKIITGQKAEIVEFDKWLAEHPAKAK